ncbi:MAG: pesticin C-terminus-like muramidase [Bryobacterales bacterium]
MVRAAIRRGDGLPNGRVWLRSVVRNAQLALIDSGHLKATSGISKTADGQFGLETEKAVKTLQAEGKLEPSGVLNRASWTRLEPYLQNVLRDRDARTTAQLKEFRGDLDWIHEKEGHRGYPYWPQGESGVTLDPGVDLGQAAPELVERLYAPLLTAAQMNAVRQVFGFQGENANAALKASAVLASIRLSPSQAADLMPYTAHDYWQRICTRFKALERKKTPPSVQTALLSLAYNRGPGNRYLESLQELLENERWNDAADKIAAMQQNHKLRGIRTRRRDEAALIRDELEFLAS